MSILEDLSAPEVTVLDLVQEIQVAFLKFNSKQIYKNHFKAVAFTSISMAFGQSVVSFLLDPSTRSLKTAMQTDMCYSLTSSNF